MSPILRTSILVFVATFFASCGGGGSGSGQVVPVTPDPGGGTGGGNTTTPLDPATADLRRHYSYYGSRFTMPYPAEWKVQPSYGNRGDIAVSFEQPPTRVNDVYSEYVEVSVAPIGTLVRSQSISVLQEIETNQISIRDLNAQEVIFDAVLAGEPVHLRFLETTFDVDDFSFSITFYGQLEGGNLQADGFEYHLPLIRRIIQEFAVGIMAIENDELLHPGEPVVATDGTRFLTVACRDESRQAYFSGSIVGVMFEPGNSRLGTEFQIDDQRIPCAGLSPSVSWDGTNYLVTYLREVSFPLIRNGQVIPNNQQTVVGKRVSSDGTVLDSDPLIISTEGMDQATNIFKGKWASDASSVFDGTRHVVVWEQLMDSDVYDQDHLRQIHGAFVDTNGVVSDNFVIFDGINGLFQTLNYAFWRPDVAVGDDRMMVVLGPRAEPSAERDRAAVYGQIVDLSGAKMHPDPILIRDDHDDKRPRYPQVEFDGENFIVAWIQGAQSPVFTNEGWYGIFARKITPDGLLLNGDAQSDGFEVMPEVEQDREFLEMHRAGSTMMVMWGEIGDVDEPGVWGTTFDVDLSSVGTAKPVWGDRTNGIFDYGPVPEYLAFVSGPSTGAAVWTTYNIVHAWFFEPDFFD